MPTLSGSLNITGSLIVNTITASFISGSIINAISSSYALTSTSASNALTSSYVNPLNQDVSITGSMVISQNLTVIGTSSFTYVTSSIIQVGANTIILNTDNPATRFGGVTVIDSGSFGTSSTGSLFWDSLNNRWIYSNPSGSTYDGGMLISGPRNTSGLGNEEGMTANFLAVGQGADHISSSTIFHSASITQITGSLTVTTTITGSGLRITGSTSSDLIKITQTGAGNAFVVEDSTSPDATPFTISSTGNTGIGESPTSLYKLYVVNNPSSGNSAGIYGVGTTDDPGVGITTGVIGYAYNGLRNIGVQGIVDDPGLVGSLTGVGGYFSSTAHVNNYSVRLSDGTEAAGKVLVSQTSLGEANWSTKLSGSYEITGSLAISGSVIAQSGNTVSSDALVQTTLLFLSNNC